MSLPEPPLSCQGIARSNGPLIPPLFRAIGSCPSLSPLPKETSLGVQSDPLVFQLDVQPRVKGIALNPSESTESCLSNGGRSHEAMHHGIVGQNISPPKIDSKYPIGGISAWEANMKFKI